MQHKATLWYIIQIFIMILNTAGNFHDKRFFLLGSKKFWVVIRSILFVINLNKINFKSKAKSIRTFNFSILYATIPHKQKLSILYSNLK